MSFEAGVVIFFRILTPDNNLARSVHPAGRSVTLDVPQWPADDYVVLDEDGNFLGAYPREWVAAIMPLETVGPANVTDQPLGRNSSPTPTEGDPQSIPRRTKRLNPH